MAAGGGNDVDLLQAFISFDDATTTLEHLSTILWEHPAVGVLAFEGLYRMQRDIPWPQLPCAGVEVDKIREILRRWRSESKLPGGPFGWEYAGAFGKVPPSLRSLTIFKTLGVPLFIDNYGTKKRLSDFGNSLDILLDENTPIYHTTHCVEANSIATNGGFIPTSNKNIIEGVWFSLGEINPVYGSKAFETTLSRLGVTALRQGEIVAYKYEINVILYAADTPEVGGLKKPPIPANSESYVVMSVFVPSRFLPEPENFKAVFNGPIEVQHTPFCVREKRTNIVCGELI